jgi:hypothetical protein
MWLFTGLVIGAFIGWNMPQPSWAKAVQERIKNALQSKNTEDK